MILSRKDASAIRERDIWAAQPKNAVERVRDNYLRSPKKSTRRCSRELQFPQRTVCKTLRKCLRFTPYKLQLVQKLYPREKKKRFEFTTLSRSRWKMILICCQR
ncbi:hypothetical protein PoB_003936700 [Plakobranchus ocellatus]|uniref:Uncharacterized protein n=1 Tax=Plakobranchus ocellatus TaxID=259542 RepID=A0AAV4B018_9GAST|nr:hypothetical protein PoB_003936700 [Plakobranchus ocellatus]